MLKYAICNSVAYCIFYLFKDLMMVKDGPKHVVPINL